MLSLLLLIIVSIINFLIGILVFFKNPKNRASQYFSVMVVFIIIWILSNYFENEPLLKDYSSLLLKIDFASAVLVFLFFYLFCLNFPKIYSLTLKKNLLICLPALLLSILSFTDLIINDIGFKNGTIQFSQGILFWAYFLGVFFYIGEGLKSLILKYKKLIGLERNQVLYVFLGFSISAAIAIIFNLILPQIIFIPSEMARIGIYGILIFCIFTALAILRYHLFEIRVILTELLVGLMGIILLVLPFVMPTSNLKILTTGIFLLFCIFAYYLIKATHGEARRREEAERLTKEVKRLDEAKTQFMLATQHHLRTPLTSIQGYLSMLLEGSWGEINQIAKSKIKGALESTQRLIRLVNEFLDIAKFEVGKEVIAKKEIRAEEIFQEIINELKPETEKKRLYLKFEKPEFLPKIMADPEKLKEAIYNVVLNGIKYTLKGGVTIKLKTQNEKLKIEISDTGIGMAKEESRGLFERTFERGEEAKKIYTTGRGIGLYLAFQIIKAHRGTIWAESPGPDKGSTFYIELPI